MIDKQAMLSQLSIQKPPQKTYYTFSEPKEHGIFFNSDFDSGNMSKVTRQSYDHYKIWTASDCQGTSYEGYPKSWFYFRTGGFINRRVAFSVHRVHFLWTMSKKHHMYRPVYRTCYKTQQDGQQTISEWNRLPHPVISIFVDQNQELVLKFDFTFKKPIQWVQFAFIYPYGYEQCRKDVLKFKQKYQQDSQLFLKQFQLGKSVQGRILDLIMISSHEGKQGFENIKTDETFSLGGQKMAKFRQNKPIIFISARVHPIETPSSFCLKGIIDFLVDKKDFRAYLLRKYFVFAIVPMLNPDGVANGHCRMDTYNQNLNRYYKTPDPKKQPSCYAVKLLAQHFNKDKRIFMYLDLHAHPAFKGNFMFGNAIFDYVNHVQSNLFPKVISNNCINFEFQQCNFSRKHMKAKDRFEDMNKQGCGRVVFYREFGVNHAYTLQCGYHCNLQNNQLSQAKNIENVYRVKFKLNAKNEKIYEIQQKKVKDPTGQYQQQGYDYFKYYGDELDDSQSAYYSRQPALYTQQTYKNLGKNILISLLDIWNRNPYTRIQQINDQRKQIAEKHSKLDRFKKQQSGIKTKKKQIVQLIQTEFYGKWHKRNHQSQSTDQKIGTRLQFLSKSNRLAAKRDQKSTLSSERMVVNAISKGPTSSDQSVPKQTIIQSTKMDVSINKFDSNKVKGSFIMKGNVSQSRITLKSENRGLRPLMNLRIKSFINYK